MTKPAEQVLAEVARLVHAPFWDKKELRELTAPYLPKPKTESDRLTLAAQECQTISLRAELSKQQAAFRAIIAREAELARAVTGFALGGAVMWLIVLVYLVLHP